MTLPRKYAVQDVRKLVEVSQRDPEMCPQKLEGLEMLLHLLAHLEHMTDEAIETEVSNLYKNCR